MPRTVQEIEADLARVRARMVSGVSLVSAGDMTTRWDNTNDPKTLAALEAELGALQGAPAVTRMFFTRVGMRRL
ncbi:hypothetical protein EAH89_17235 [Roseomonas nepalensis]|uniref:Uncharacterized protein n=1 Tax=Muricoccus nepalensis TaxID=1854500 RepID=A0A502FV14_9PROT|nr:hypothetical protein [Roseomonas nepalensis]TPG53261.1 hypothetical protein EAH89_17235 [Roseomonas nepalensis]